MFPIRVKTVQESDLRMLGSLARNIQRVLPVTQADIDAAAALGKGWVVWKVFEVSDPLDNLRGGTQLIIRQNNIQPGQNVRRVIFVAGPGGQTVVIRGTDYIVLPDAIANSLSYVKAFGGTEQGLPSEYQLYTEVEAGGVTYTYSSQNLTQIPCMRIADNVFGLYNLITQMFTGDATFISNGTPITSPSPQYDIPLVSNNGVLKVRHQSGLPLGYTLLDGVTNANAGCLDTGIIADVDDMEFDIVAKINDSAPVSWYILQSRAGSGYPIYGISGSQSNNTLIGSFCGTNVGAGTTIVRKRGHTYHINLKCQNGTITLTVEDLTDNTSTTATGTYTFAAATTNIGLFNNLGGGSVVSGNTSVTSAYIKKSGVKVLDYVPALQGTTAGFYDKVTGTFKGATAGSFVAGTAVSDPVEIYTDGTVETINAHGKNWFDKDTMWVEGKAVRAGGVTTDNPLGSEIVSNSWNCSDYMPVSPNTTYTYTIPASLNVSSAGTVFFRDKTIEGAISGFTNSNALERTFTTPEDCHFLRFSWRESGNTNVQLELGSTATEYEPYYDGGTATTEMLLKVGDYQDVQSIIDGVVTRNVGVKVLDGTETWTKATGTGGGQFVFYINTTGDCVVPFNNTICNIATGAENTWGAGTDKIVVRSNKNFGFLCPTNMTSDSTATDWATYVAAQYAAGTPVIIIYPLETPTTESVTGQTLQVTDGDNVLEITQASLNGLELEAEYQAAVSLTIQEVQDANLDPNVEVTIN